MLPAVQESATPHQFSFSGSELFRSDIAVQIDALIQQLITEQRSNVNKLCGSINIGWDKSGFPETSKISDIEQAVKRHGCLSVALMTAGLLGKDLDKDEIIDLVSEDPGYNVRNIPEKVFKLIQKKK